MLKLNLQDQIRILKKYLFPLGFALLTFAFAVYVIEENRSQIDNDPTLRMLSMIALGIAIGFGIEFLEFLNPRNKKIARILGAFLILMQVVLVIDIGQRRYSYLYANYFLMVHLFVALSFWFNSKNKFQDFKQRYQYFWDQNWRLFMSFQASVLVNLVLFAGLALGILSLDFLFSYKPPENTIYYLFIFLVTVGGSYYLASAYESSANQPTDSRILDTLVRFVFPLLQILYFLILYIYLIKITIAWFLPRGYIGWLVSGLSVLICLSHLIIKPVQDKVKLNKITQLVWRYSFIMIIPLLGLLLVALFRRINEYGVSENRYILLLLTLWMLYIAVTHLRPEKSKLQMIPLSLFIITLFTTTGPFNAYTIAHWSQRKRVQHQLSRLHGTFENNLFSFPQKVETADQKKFVLAVKSVCETYGVKELYEMLGSKDVPDVPDSENKHCVYRSGYNESTASAFGKLLESTKFDVILHESLYYNYVPSVDNDVEVSTDTRKTFQFKIKPEVTATRFENREFDSFLLSSNNNEKQGSSQLIFQKTGMDQMTWFPTKGDLKIVDLKPLMVKLSKVSKDYLFANHPEDQKMQIENQKSRVFMTIKEINFEINSQKDLQIESVHFSAMAVDK